ncbi:uncharacterized protein A4U43_C03F14120 [Asparagus officinalis]|uniref:Gnk2-homologous domain-containing protein n=2 Tax=Asparagus officinalis TaxID=4686 RepID=A0A5P1FBQ2_ASPOF|nr:uncharacterized protein A4U43_C03F14120 [Asparagus officinalis]
MHCLKQFLLPLLSVSLLLKSVASTYPLSTSCSSSEKYSDGDSFSNNLNQLIFVLATGSPSLGFGLGSIGQDPNKVNGLALCRGDVPSSECKRCIHTADAYVRRLCPFEREAIIWFDQCLLRYSDTEFFGEIDHKHKLYLQNTQNVTIPQLRFQAKVVELMYSLKTKAYLSPLLFATGMMEIGSEKLYGLAQCSRDLSGGDCKRCLEVGIDKMAGYRVGKRGGRFLGGSCNVRYELYSFFDSDDIPQYSQE